MDQLEGRLDLLAQAFTARVRQIPEYGDSQVTVPEIRDTARETFRRLIHGLRGGPAGHGTGRAARLCLGPRVQTGARAGIPPESLTSAVRLDFSILWADLLEIAAPEDAGLLASRVDQVWRVVDEFATRTHMSYLTERVRMAQEESSIQREFIARLFNQSTPSAETSAPGRLRPGHRAGCPLRPRRCQRRRRRPPSCGRYPVRRRPAPPQRSSSTNPAETPTCSGRSCPGRRRPEARRNAERAAAAAGPWRTSPAAMFWKAFPGLRALPSAARTAERLLALLLHPSDKGPLTAAGAWARLAKRRLPGRRAGSVGGPGLGALADAAAGNVNAWRKPSAISCPRGISPPRRQALFCHRNTILNRLHRFQDLTGIDLAVPAQAARLVVACAWP